MIPGSGSWLVIRQALSSQVMASRQISVRLSDFIGVSCAIQLSVNSFRTGFDRIVPPGRINEFGFTLLEEEGLTDKTTICFVCLGNIVRSPLAENMFRHLADQAGVSEKYAVDSAGTARYHIGESPDGRMRRVAARQGLRYDGSARQFQRQDFDRFDWIVAMDPDNRADLERLAPGEGSRNKIRLMREFDPHGGSQAGVPDPYYGGIDGFEEVYRIVERSCRGLLAALEDGELSG